MRDGGIRERRLDLAVLGVGLCLGLLLGWPLAAATAGASPPEADLVSGRSTREVAAIAAEVTVRIRGEGCLGTTMGTGVRVGPGEVLTASHVVAGERVTTVVDASGEETTGRDIARLGVLDAATVRTGSSQPWVRPRVGRARVGERVVVAGSAGGGPVVTRSATVRGELSGRAPGDPSASLILDVEATPGDSGGPVLDLDGRLVGIVYARANADGRALVIPVDAIPFGSGNPGVAC